MQPTATTIHPFPARKLLYVEVPKAGCTSIKISLSPLREAQGWHSSDEMDIHEWMGYTFLRSSQLHRVLTEKYRDWTVFTVVRHPLKRFRSLFFDKLLADETLSPDLNSANLLSDEKNMEKFIDAFARSPWYLSNHHGRPQTTIIGKDLSYFNYVGRNENMADVYAFLNKYLSINAVPIQAHKSYSDPKWEFSKNIQERIYELYKDDYKVLGYEHP